MQRLTPLVMIVILTALVACGSSGQSVGERIATNECVECHANLITCTKLGREKPYWEKTVQRMVDKDMDITEEEAAAVTEYLTSLEAGASPICD